MRKSNEKERWHDLKTSNENYMFSTGTIRFVQRAFKV